MYKIIRQDSDIQELRDYFSKCSFDKLSMAYTTVTGNKVIDERDDSEYTNIEAQDDPYFWAEEPL